MDFQLGLGFKADRLYIFFFFFWIKRNEKIGSECFTKGI